MLRCPRLLGAKGAGGLGRCVTGERAEMGAGEATGRPGRLGPAGLGDSGEASRREGDGECREGEEESVEDLNGLTSDGRRMDMPAADGDEESSWGVRQHRVQHICSRENVKGCRGIGAHSRKRASHSFVNGREALTPRPAPVLSRRNRALLPDEVWLTTDAAPGLPSIAGPGRRTPLMLVVRACAWPAAGSTKRSAMLVALGGERPEPDERGKAVSDVLLSVGVKSGPSARKRSESRDSRSSSAKLGEVRCRAERARAPPRCGIGGNVWVSVEAGGEAGV